VKLSRSEKDSRETIGEEQEEKEERKSVNPSPTGLLARSRENKITEIWHSIKRFFMRIYET